MVKGAPVYELALDRVVVQPEDGVFRTDARKVSLSKSGDCGLGPGCGSKNNGEIDEAIEMTVSSLWPS